MLAKNLFENPKNVNLISLKYHILDHIVEDVSLDKAANFWYASLLGYFDYIVEWFIMMASLWRGNTMDQVMNVTNSWFAIEERRDNAGGKIRKGKVITDSAVFNLG